MSPAILSDAKNFFLNDAFTDDQSSVMRFDPTSLEVAAVKGTLHSPTPRFRNQRQGGRVPGLALGAEGGAVADQHNLRPRIVADQHAK